VRNSVELTVKKLRERIRNNKMTFPSQVPAFSGQPKAKILWRMAALFFVGGWSYPTLAARYGLCAEYVRLLIKQWTQRAIHLGLIQEIPSADALVNLKQAGTAARKSEADFKTRTVTFRGRKIRMTHSELVILESLIARLNRTVPRYELVKHLSEANGREGLHSLRPLIRSLRCKLEPNPASPQYLITDRTVGYRLKAPWEEPEARRE
jgi:DNA-binding winged helix-turn-helix (wHTH) protein